MSLPKPEFHLRRVYSDGSSGDLEVAPLLAPPADLRLSRRGVLGVGVAIGSVLAAAASDSRRGVASAQDAPPPVPGARLQPIRAHSTEVRAIAFTPQGDRLLSLGDGERAQMKLWRMPRGEWEATIEDAATLSFVSSIEVSSDGRHAVTVGRELRVFDLTTMARVATVSRAFYGPLTVVRDDLVAYYAGEREPGSAHTMVLASLPKLSETNAWTVELPTNAIAVAQGTMVACSNMKDGVTVWRVPVAKDAVPEWTVPPPETPDNAAATLPMAASPEGKLLLVGRGSGAIDVYSLLHKVFLRRVPVHQRRITELAFAPSGTFVVAMSAGGDCKVLSRQDWSVTQTPPMTGETFAVQRCMAISPDSRTLAVGFTSGEIVLIDLTTGRRLGYLFDPKANTTEVTASRFEAMDTVTKQSVVYTLPCGSPIPPGATCLCNCVPGTMPVPTPPRPIPPPSPPSTGGGGTYCSCNQVCICNLVYR